MLPRKDYDKAKQVEKEMCELTGLFIEDSFYSKVIQIDVNDYIGVYTDHTIEQEHLKLKGCFEINKELYKDSSMKIVPIALKEYFVNNIPIEQTIRNHTNIFDFCLRLKLNSKTQGYYEKIENGILSTESLQRTTRYYISNKGGSLVKVFEGNKRVGVNVGYVTTIFNKFVEKENYDINYNFYISEAYKIKNSINNNQIKLF